MLKGKRIVLGVTGGIAAYKAADLVSRLKKSGAEVFVIMTAHASEFVMPLTFQTLSQNPVVTDMFDAPPTWDVEHISLAKKADLFVIAPASANVIGKLAAGIADDMLTTTVMATRAPVLLAPAMNTNMYLNPVVQRNIVTLRELGYHFEDPGTGRLACADVGVGKMAEPQDLLNRIRFLLHSPRDLEGVPVLITAGPTREPIDPVRYITNHSSGKMGYALAEQAALRGAAVTLISGKTALQPPPGVELVSVTTAAEMHAAVMARYEACRVLIKAAAVADYRPRTAASQKLKKKDEELSIPLERTMDIALELARLKGDRVFVGFAAETEDLIAHAAEKVRKKHFDFIVANNVLQSGAGFDGDTNIVTLLDADGDRQSLDLMRKAEVADVILDRVVRLLSRRAAQA